MDGAQERDFLIGIEPLCNSSTSTPRRSHLERNLAKEDVQESESMNSSLSKSSDSTVLSPMKLSDFSSPVKTTGALSNSVHEITKHIQESLASSLKLQKEAESNAKKSRGDLFGYNSAGNTPLSLTPLKAASPSKQVRFEDNSMSKSVDSQGKENVRPQSPLQKFTPPIQTSRQDFLVSPSRSECSPTKQPSYRVSLCEDTALTAEASLFSSLKVPRNEKERQKLNEFLQQMESSASADPLASLFNLEYDLKLSDLNSKSAAVGKPNPPAKAVPFVSNPAEKDGGFQIKKRKSNVKRNLERRDFGRKNAKPLVENIKKAAVSKKSTVHTKKNDQKTSKNSERETRRKLEPVAVPLMTTEGQMNIGNMEAIRSHLQGMLKMDGVNFTAPSTTDDDSQNRDDERSNSPQSCDTATLLSAKPYDPSAPSSRAAHDDMEALIDSATSSMFSLLKGNKTQPPVATDRPVADSSMTAEIAILRDTLEKERYRRNHCEKHIQNLQNRILEIQQELAVGQSVTRKKDMMIEQLDKTLAKVVGGWKNHEQSLVNSVQSLTEEKTKLTSELDQKNRVVAELKSKFTKALEELSMTREKLLLKEEEQTLLQQTFQLKTHEISRVLDQKNASIEKLLNDKQAMVADIKKLTTKIEETQDSAEQQKKKFSQDLVKEKKSLQEQLKKEKTKTDQAKSRNADLQKMLSSTQEEVSRLEELMSSLKQTIENMKLQGTVEEAKYSAAIRKIHAEHQIELEKRVTEKLAKFHEEAEKKEKELRDNHYKQVIEITRGHEQELSKQCKMYEERIEQLEHRAREDLESKDRKFVDLLKEKTEGMRQQMLSKMQNLLQAHYNEALEVVGNTTGNTPMRPQAGLALSGYLQDFHSSNRLFGGEHQDVSSMRVSTATLSDSLRQTSTTASVDKSHACGDRVDMMGNLSGMSPALPKDSVSHPYFTTHMASSAFAAVTSAAQPARSLPGIQSSASNTFIVSIPTCSRSRTQDEPNPQTVQSSYEAEINLPVSTLITPKRDEQSDNSVDDERKNCLQHYIKMLLDRSPGEPLDIPQPSAAPIQPSTPTSMSDLSPIYNPSKAITNKENHNADPALPKHATSEIALGVIDFLNQQLNTQPAQPSPDVIPVEKPAPYASSNGSKSAPSGQTSRNRASAFSHVKIGDERLTMKPNVRPQGWKKSPKKHDPRLSTRDTEGNQATVNQQIGDVSRMLSSYMAGDTQAAAEKLISYLSESQRKGTEEASVRGNHLNKSIGKSKTPSKSSQPVWR